MICVFVLQNLKEKAVGKKDSDTFDRLKEYIYQEWLECTKK